MEYVRGRNLAEIALEGPLPARRAAQYAKTVAEAIQYAHEQGVLHRDLKPSNILIDENDQPRRIVAVGRMPHPCIRQPDSLE